jgi:hypothetical protein
MRLTPVGAICGRAERSKGFPLSSIVVGKCLSSFRLSSFCMQPFQYGRFGDTRLVVNALVVMVWR